MYNNKEKEELILRHQNLVRSILKKFNNLHNEDLFQIGMIGLIKAAENYDETKGTAFISFAYKCISNEILIYFRNQKQKTFNTVSYNTIIDEENSNITLEDCLGYTPDFDENIRMKELYDNIDKTLSPIEKTIISYYYGLYNTIPISQTQLSKKFNVSQAFISRTIKSAKAKLKIALEDNYA